MFCECDIYHRGNTQCNVKCRIIVFTKPQVRIRFRLLLNSFTQQASAVLTLAKHGKCVFVVGQLLYKNRPVPAADKGRARYVKSIWPPSVAIVFKKVLICQQGGMFNRISPHGSNVLHTHFLQTRLN